MVPLRYLWLVTCLKLRLQWACYATFANVRFHVRPEHYQLRAIFKQQAIQPVLAKLINLCDAETLFLDIGANIGLFSLLISAKTGARALTFEPVRSTFHALVQNCACNPHLPIAPLNTALGASPCIVEITAIPGSGVNQIAAVAERPDEPRQSVPQLTLDQLKVADLLGTQQKLVVKIDVERYELEVLAGAKDLLALKVPMVLCIEVPRSQQDQVSDFLGTHFHPIQPMPDTSFPINPDSDSDDLFYANDAWLQKL
ncbi:FkbM family methyltransferase [Synechococcus elongatus]|uniref:FkbM family methyltransferase n=1 Tax=Synechococcus elongatus PCC 11802 TaxID=2283154 RepID=A0AAT9JVV4_SYNEL|nr:FkbM family methyltransferase [Synechococcus elongatus]QFZ91311.1 FkbM family methyltransferase [Synechococcus elongatus PCC 11802]